MNFLPNIHSSTRYLQILTYSHKHTYKAHTVSKCNINTTKIKDILKHAEAISSNHKITKQH